MMYGGSGDSWGTAIAFLCVVSVLTFWGGYELTDWLFIDDAIRTTEIIVPELEIVVKDNVIDTVYVYREPK